jgi:carbamoyltransferase
MRDNNKYIIGLNIPLDYNNNIAFNGSGVLFQKNIPILGIAEERLSRIKYDGNFKQTLKLFLDYISHKGGHLDAVAITSICQPTFDNIDIKTFLFNKVKKHLPDKFKPQMYYCDSHHETHALAAISQNESNNSLIVVCDHTGSIIGKKNTNNIAALPIEQVTYYLFCNNELKLLDRDFCEPSEIGFGKLFGRITNYLGFSSYHEAGKIMGLSSFGDPKIFSSFCLTKFKNNGRLISDMVYKNDFKKINIDIENCFRNVGKPLSGPRNINDKIKKIDMNLASWVQNETQQALLSRIKQFLNKYEVDTVCLVGGVALNSVMNTYITKALPNINVFIPPSPCDSGISLGAVVKYLFERDGNLPRFKPPIYFGSTYGDHDYKKAKKYAIAKSLSVSTIEPIEVAIKLLDQGKIIAWFQGRSEFGPRALGNRSILASPANNWTKEVLNHQVKLREWFRPYAPAICVENLQEFTNDNIYSPFMMKISTVRNDCLSKVLSCVHVDGTARLQTVDKKDNPLFYNLIDHFKNVTGIPALLNTSFNLAGMPIVESPFDAIDCFLNAEGLDALIIDKMIYLKE